MVHEEYANNGRPQVKQKQELIQLRVTLHEAAAQFNTGVAHPIKDCPVQRALHSMGFRSH